MFNNFAIDPASSGFDPNFGGVINKGLFLYYHNLVPGSAADPFCLGDAACQVHVLQSTPRRDCSPASDRSDRRSEHLVRVRH